MAQFGFSLVHTDKLNVPLWASRSGAKKTEYSLWRFPSYVEAFSFSLILRCRQSEALRYHSVIRIGDVLDIWCVRPQRPDSRFSAIALEDGSEEKIEDFWPQDGEVHKYLFVVSCDEVQAWRDGSVLGSLSLPMSAEHYPIFNIVVGDGFDDKFAKHSAVISINDVRIWHGLVSWCDAFGRKRLADEDVASANKMRGMWEHRRFTDAEVRTGETVFSVHRAVLAGSSPVFASMFENEEMKEGRGRVVAIAHVSPLTTEALLKYSYGCDIAESCDFCELLHLADQYQMPNLVSICCVALMTSLTKQTLVSIVHALRPLRHNGAVCAAWAALQTQISDRNEFAEVMMENV